MWNPFKNTSPDNGHCWHRVHSYGPFNITHWKVDTCCYCSLTWDPDVATQEPQGHGEYAPPERGPKPTGRCPKR